MALSVGVGDTMCWVLLVELQQAEVDDRGRRSGTALLSRRRGLRRVFWPDGPGDHTRSSHRQPLVDRRSLKSVAEANSPAAAVHHVHTRLDQSDLQVSDVDDDLATADDRVADHLWPTLHGPRSAHVTGPWPRPSAAVRLPAGRRSGATGRARPAEAERGAHHRCRHLLLAAAADARPGRLPVPHGGHRRRPTSAFGRRQGGRLHVRDVQHSAAADPGRRRPRPATDRRQPNARRTRRHRAASCAVRRRGHHPPTRRQGVVRLTPSMSTHCSAYVNSAGANSRVCF